MNSNDLKPLAEEFQRYLESSYPKWRDMPISQKLALEDGFYAGALIGFNISMFGTREQVLGADGDIREFGMNILNRYIEAGIIPDPEKKV